MVTILILVGIASPPPCIPDIVENTRGDFALIVNQQQIGIGAIVDQRQPYLCGALGEELVNSFFDRSNRDIFFPVPAQSKTVHYCMSASFLG